MKLRLIALSLAVLASPAFAENWRASSSADGATAFIDVESIRRDGDRVTFWREVRWPEVRSLGDGTRFDRVANHYEADCRAMRFRSVALQARLETEVVLAFEHEEEYDEAHSGSTIEADLRAVCFDTWTLDQ